MNDDLIYTRADMEAAIKRALDAAYQKAAEWADPIKYDWSNWASLNIHYIPFAIRALDPAQFIEEPKP